MLDEAALKVLKAAEATKQLLQQKEEVLAEIRGEFEQKSKEVTLASQLYMYPVYVALSMTWGCKLLHTWTNAQTL